jgi:hypothetical protein
MALAEVALAGISARRWVWDFTGPVRFAGDMQRNFLYGSRAQTEGYLNIYENVYANRVPGDYDIDYPPLRLLTFYLWIRILNHQHIDVSEWNPSYEFNAPLLDFNTCTEAASTIAVFLIIRRWTRAPCPHAGSELLPRAGSRGAGFETTSNWESWSRSAFGALLVWFSPAGMVDGHGWATYDVWIPPYFLCTILLLSCDYWLAAGIVLGIGAMFKGQMLLVAPIFLIYPLLAGQPLRALRLLAGFIILTAAVAAPFILSNEVGETGVRIVHSAAIAWIACVAIAGALPHLWRLPRVAALSKIVRRFLLAGLFELAALLALWPVVLRGNHSLWPIMFCGVALYLAAAWFLRGRWFALLTISATAASVFASMALFASSPAWWTVGFRYGSEKFFHLIQGPNVNLAALLQWRYNWRELTDLAVTLPAHLVFHWPAQSIDLTNRQFLLALYFVGLALCSIAAAVHWRRRDTRFLVAVSTIWLMFYCLLPQMIVRYLLFGATVAAITVAESFGLGLIAFFLSLVAAIGTLQTMAHANDWSNSPNADVWTQLVTFFNQTIPSIAWAVLMASAVFLCVSLNLKRRSPPARPETPVNPPIAVDHTESLEHN